MSARRSISLVLVWLCAAAGALLWYTAPASAQRLHEFSLSFGSEGSGNGQFIRPGALAVSEVGPAAGDVYVIDEGNRRVEIFDSAGAYLGQFNGEGSPTGRIAATNAVPDEVAVDNSTNPLDPSAGDVYVMDTSHDVVDKFGPKGEYIGQITGGSPGNSPFKIGNGTLTGLYGIGVDANGSLWVEVGDVEGTSHEGLEELNDAYANEYVSSVMPKLPANIGFNSLGLIGLAFDSEGNFYIGKSASADNEFANEVAAEFTGSGTLLAGEVDSDETTGVAVDRSSDDVYLDNRSTVAAFGPSGMFVERFGAPEMSSSEGIAVNSSTGAVYVSDAGNQAVEVFTAFVVPDVSTGSASSFAETSATVGGVVNPEGLPVSSCVFEYGTSGSYGQEAPCSQTTGEIGSGEGPVSVSAALSGLEPLTRYHFRLRVANANGSNVGQDRTFVTPMPVALGEESVSDVASSSARFSAQVNPGGAAATFHFEYGTSVFYGASVPAPAGDLGAGTSAEPVSVDVQGLRPGTTYHVRLAATNLLGTVYGPDEVFTTQAAGGAFALPDGRTWELVSPPSKYGALIEAQNEGVVEAAEDGSAITYYASGSIVASPAGNPSPLGDVQALSSRAGGGGWSTEEIATPHNSATATENAHGESEYLFFSSDLSSALVEPAGESTPLSPEASQKTLYLRDDGTGGYRPLVMAGNVPAGTEFGMEGNLEGEFGTPDLSHVLLRSKATLTTNAVKTETNERSIYEWSSGQLTLVNVLPEAQGGGATPLGVLGYLNEDTRHAISNDGSRVFWSEAGTFDGGSLYMRDTAIGRTVEVDAPAPGVSQPQENHAIFETASGTGSEVFFLDTEPLTADSKLVEPTTEHGRSEYDLYVYDTETGTLNDLTVDQTTNEFANVQNMVLGANEEGSIVYFVATGKLTEGAQAGADNLYVESKTGATWSAPRLIAVLSEEDGASWGKESSLGSTTTAGLSSRLSSNGRFLTFMSDKSLTGYDNRDAGSGQPDEEVYLYDEATGGLTCVSCNPTGAPPVGVFDRPEGEHKPLLADRKSVWGGRWLAADIPAWELVTESGSILSTYQSRYISNEGRLFFTSFDSLVPQDTNGEADVYEYEPEGVGGCATSGGCVSLISSGTASGESAFLDASGRGPGGEEAEDVFFLTTARLVAQDVDSSFDIYDAHVCSSAVPCVSSPVASPACSSGDSCKPAPSLQPAIFGVPASATFAGVGNPQSPPGAVATKHAAKKRVKHKKKKKGRRRRPPHRRAKRSTARGSHSTGVGSGHGKGR